MSLPSGAAKGWLPAFGVALPMVIIFVTVLSIPLAAAPELRLSAAQLSGWILVVYGLPGVLSLGLAVHYRQPLLLTGNVFAIIFVASLGGQFSYPELAGAFVVAGAIVLLVGALDLTGRLAAWIPTPIVFGVLAGALLPFVAGVFTALGEAPALVGAAFAAYLLSRRLLGPRLFPVLPALVVGIAAAGLTGSLGPAPGQLALPATVVTMPVFSVRSIVTVTPVLVVLIVLQSNLTSVVYLRGQGYQPPERATNVVSGLGTMIGSLLGPTAVSIALPAVPILGGPEAGDLGVRHRSVYVAASALVLIALLAGVAADLAAIVPRPLLLALAGLAMVGILAGALKEVTRGPLLLGPLFAFAVSLSGISLLGLGPFFWALVFGTTVSLLLERDEWKALRAGAKG